MKTLSNKASILVACLLASPCIGTAASISLTPTSGILGTSRWEGIHSNSNGAFLAFVSTVTTSTELYKQNTPGSEEGILAGSYITDITSLVDPLSNSAGKITYGGGDIVGSVAYIGFKDGSHDPNSYLFNLTALGWTGTEEISWSGFWPAKGEISHVSLFGIKSSLPNTVGVPTPDGGTTLAFFGLALFGLGSMRRFLAAKA